MIRIALLCLSSVDSFLAPVPIRRFLTCSSSWMTEPISTQEFLTVRFQKRPLLLLPNTEAAFQFYVYCVLAHLKGAQAVRGLLSAVPRMVDAHELDQFLSQLKKNPSEFQILEYKLKRYDSDPLGLFLIGRVAAQKTNSSSSSSATTGASSSLATVAAASVIAASSAAASAMPQAAPSMAASASAAAPSAASSSGVSASPLPASLLCVHVHYASDLSHVASLSFFKHSPTILTDPTGAESVEWLDPTVGSKSAHGSERNKKGCMTPGSPCASWNWLQVCKDPEKAFAPNRFRPNTNQKKEIKQCALLVEWIDQQMKQRSEPRWSDKCLSQWKDTISTEKPFPGLDGRTWIFRSMQHIFPHEQRREASTETEWFRRYLQRFHAQLPQTNAAGASSSSSSSKGPVSS